MPNKPPGPIPVVPGSESPPPSEAEKYAREELHRQATLSVLMDPEQDIGGPLNIQRIGRLLLNLSYFLENASPDDLLFMDRLLSGFFNSQSLAELDEVAWGILRKDTAMLAAVLTGAQKRAAEEGRKAA